MFQATLRFLEIFSAICACASIAYYCFCIWSAVKFLHAIKHARRPSDFQPSVSILKPLKGIDSSMYQAFRTHCLPDYREYEIIFGVSEADDPALKVVEELQKEFPGARIQSVVCEKELGTNVKVSNLVQMLEIATHEHIVVNDADISVPPNYLSRIMAPLADSKVGLVTCLYRGLPARSLCSRLEALGVSTDFVAGVLVAEQLEDGLSFGLGSTLAFRKRDLQAAGGFEKFLDYLADDYELGRSIAASGQKVVLSECVVQTSVGDYGWRQFFEHQLRWSRTIRDARRWGYLGFGVTFGIWWALLALMASRGAVWSWALLGVVLAARGAAAGLVGWRVLHDRTVLSFPYLIPVRDVAAFWTWLAGWFGGRVKWRGQEYVLKRGRLVRAG